MNSIFNTLRKRSGTYSRKYLIHIYDADENISMRFINDNEDLTYNNKTYTAGCFNYTPKASERGLDGGGTLEITVKDNYVIDLIETYNNIRLDVEAILLDNGTVSEVIGFNHKYGTVTGSRTQVSFDFEADDRNSMTFPTLLWSTQNNRGNS